MSIPDLEATRSDPVCSRMKEPVPYVFLAMPTSVHAWPKSAACWSPAIPLIGAATPPSVCGSVVEMRPLESRTSGRFASGTPKTAAISSLQPPAPMSKSSVREAFEASVMWSRPAESLATNQLSTVPIAAPAAPGMCFIAQPALVAVK